MLIRILASPGDEAHRQELLERLRELRSNTALAFAVNTHTAVLEVRSTLVEVDTKVTTLADGVAELLVSTECLARLLLVPRSDCHPQHNDPPTQCFAGGP